MTKQHTSDLAVFGGRPAFAEPLHVGRPNIGDRQRLLDRVNDILDRRWLTNDGTYVQQFERRIADLAEVKHCVAVCNGAIGLEIGIRALDLTGEVIVPAFTFIATAHALEWQQITPVFADVDPRTHLLDPDSVRSLITPRTTGIMGVHLWGQVGAVESLQTLADDHGLRLLFDAAHAFGCGTPGRRAGGFGALEVFSFHATKFVNSLEGGAIVTNDDALAAKMRLMRNFGFRGYDDVAYIGTNGKMHEFSAAMGLTSIEAMDGFTAINRRNHDLYRRELAGIPGLTLLTYEEAGGHNYQYVVADIAPAACPIARDVLLDVLWAENIRARRYFYPGCHRMEPYRSRDPRAGDRLPITERVSAGVLVLPNGQVMEPEHIRDVCAVIRCAVANGDEIGRRLDSAGQRVHEDVFAR